MVMQGISLRQQGGDYWVCVNSVMVDEGVRQKWGSQGSRPLRPDGTSSSKNGYVDKQRLILMQQMVHMQMQLAAMSGTPAANTDNVFGRNPDPSFNRQGSTRHQQTRYR